MKKSSYLSIICSAALCAVSALSCDSGGLPVKLVIDEYTMDINVDNIMASALVDMQNRGLISPNTAVFPILWPESLPAVNFLKDFVTEPAQFDLTPEEGSPEAEKYGDIGTATKMVKRIDIDRMVIRFDVNSLTWDSPELLIQVAGDKNASAEDRLAWRTIGIVPAKPAGWVGDMDFEFVPGGERYLKTQLMENEKEFAVRIRSALNLKLAPGNKLPAGKLKIRLIIAGTFFVDAKEAIGTITDEVSKAKDGEGEE